MVSNLTISDASQAPNRIYDVIKKTQLTSLKDVRTGAYALAFETLRELRTQNAFNEIRVKCRKEVFGKLVHVAFNNVDQLVGIDPMESRTITQGRDFRFLPGDEFESFYSAYTVFKKGSEHLYGHSMYISGVALVALINDPGRFECGDYVSVSPSVVPGYTYDPVGNWQYYVR